MASTSKHLKEEIDLDILNELEECVIRDSTDDSDNREDANAIADAAVTEDSQMEEESQGYSLGDSDYKRGFIWKDMENYHGCEHRRRNMKPSLCNSLHGWHRLEGPTAANVPRRKEVYAQMVQSYSEDF
jgi:hypothetical protein